MMNKGRTILSLTSAAWLLASCGSGGAPPVSSAPPPSPTPSPTPTPSPAGVIKPELFTIGTNSTTVAYTATETNEFAGGLPPNSYQGTKLTESITASKPGTADATIEISFDEEARTYQMTLPDGASGNLRLRYLNGSSGQVASSAHQDLVDQSGKTAALVLMPVPFREGYPYTYSHFGSWTSNGTSSAGVDTETYGWFVYGYETPAAAVPRTGVAKYTAEIRGNSPLDVWEIRGPVTLMFDFGAGTLSGEMHPVFDTNGWYSYLDYDYGVYQFAETVYSVGSPKYSGKFSKDGVLLSESWFDGSLTGPNAQEVIGRFAAPFDRDGYKGVLTGIWIGKKD